MSKVFDASVPVMAVYDNSRKELIVLQAMGKSDVLFNDTFIMNFSSNDRADFQLSKSLANGFGFTAFGHNITTIVISGYQAKGTKYFRNGSADNSITGSSDAENFYRKHCISSDDPSLIKITTGTSGAVDNGTVYRGYMVAFSKKPMGTEKIQGYSFDITFACEKYDK